MFYLPFAVIIHRYCYLIKNYSFKLRENFWEFNCPLRHDELYVLKMKKHIENMLIINIINSFDSDFNHQIKWEFFKYEIRKFTRSFSKNKAKSMREKKLNLEKKTKTIRRKVKL